ncbi:MAG: hypothetical protein ACK5QB_09045 [Pseudanabaena sp.]
MAGLNGVRRRDLAGMLSSTTEIQTGYVLESLGLEVDSISLSHRQTYGHNHTALTA